MTLGMVYEISPNIARFYWNFTGENYSINAEIKGVTIEGEPYRVILKNSQRGKVRLNQDKDYTPVIEMTGYMNEITRTRNEVDINFDSEIDISFYLDETLYEINISPYMRSN